VVLQLGGWARCLQLLTVETYIVMKHFTSPWNWAGHVACTGERRDAYMVLEERPGGKNPFGRPR